jgi:hypothetical protein
LHRTLGLIAAERRNVPDLRRGEASCGRRETWIGRGDAAVGSASPAPTTADEPIGNVATPTGTVTVIRSKNSLPIKLRDDIYFHDTVQTSASSTLGHHLQSFGQLQDHDRQLRL